MKKIISFVLCVAMIMCAGVVAGATCNHSYAETEVEATCVERAHTLYTCTDCGDTYKEYVSPVTYPEKPYFSVEGERVGDVLNVKVIIGNNPGVWATGLDLYYNTKALELIEKANGEIWGANASVNVSEPLSDGRSHIRFWCDSSSLEENNTKNGVMFTVSFNILGSVDDWGVAFEIKYKHVINKDGDVVPFEIINTVTAGYGEHAYDKGEIITPPAYDREGEIEYSCKRCPKTKIDAIPRLDPIPGDADLNGKLDARDCIIIKSYLVNALSNDVVLGDLDANGDGAINSKDLLYLKKSFVETN